MQAEVAVRAGRGVVVGKGVYVAKGTLRLLSGRGKGWIVHEGVDGIRAHCWPVTVWLRCTWIFGVDEATVGTARISHCVTRRKRYDYPCSGVVGQAVVELVVELLPGVVVKDVVEEIEREVK